MYHTYGVPGLLVCGCSTDVSPLRGLKLFFDIDFYRCIVPTALPMFRLYEAPALLTNVGATDVLHLRCFWLGANGCSLVLILLDLFPGCDYTHQHCGAAPVGALTSVANTCTVTKGVPEGRYYIELT